MLARGLARTSARSWRILVQTLSGPGAAVGRSFFNRLDRTHLSLDDDEHGRLVQLGVGRLDVGQHVLRVGQ